MAMNFKARITGIERWNDYHLFSLEAPEIAAESKPGQFLMIKVTSQTFPLLRRPLSIHGRNGNNLEIFFQVAGTGTNKLAQKKVPDSLDILGPLGRGFTLSPGLKGTNVLCVGGGRGIAPLYFAAVELRALGALPVILYGGKTAADLPLRSKFEKSGFRVLCSTDDGSFGCAGFVTGLLEDELQRQRPAFLFACGPDAMMKAAAAAAARRGLPAEFSLESLMGCGIGACWGCVKRVRRQGREEWVKICEDGPVFPSKDIVWTEEP